LRAKPYPNPEKPCPSLTASPAGKKPCRDYLTRLTDNPDAHRGRWQWQETG